MNHEFSAQKGEGRIMDGTIDQWDGQTEDPLLNTGMKRNLVSLCQQTWEKLGTEISSRGRKKSMRDMKQQPKIKHFPRVLWGN